MKIKKFLICLKIKDEKICNLFYHDKICNLFRHLTLDSDLYILKNPTIFIFIYCERIII